MKCIILIILTLLGIISIFTVSKWNRWFFRYESVLNCPLEFSESPINRLLYWSFPLALFFVSLIFFNVQLIYLILIYAASMEAGQLYARKQFIDWITDGIIRDHDKSSHEARKEAKLIEKNTKLMRKHL